MIGAVGAGILGAVFRGEFFASKAGKVKAASEVEALEALKLLERAAEADVETIEISEKTDESSLNQALFTDQRSFLTLAEHQTGLSRPVTPIDEKLT